METIPMVRAGDSIESSEEDALYARPSIPCRWRRVLGPMAGVLVLGLALSVLVIAQPAQRPAHPAIGLEEEGIIEYVATDATDSAPTSPAPHGGIMNCSRWPYLKLQDISLRNLGGKGPDTDRVPGIVYQGFVIGGPHDTENFELHLNVTSDPNLFEPQSVHDIGFQGQYGSINIKAGTNVTVSVQKFDPENQVHVPFERFFFTFFDLDQGPGGSASESVTVRGWSRAFLANRTEVEVTRLPDGRTRFEASTEGSGDDNPRDPLALTRQQFRRAVTVLVENVETFEVTFAVGSSPGDNPRWFDFRGQPTLLCAAREDGSPFNLQVIGGDSGGQRVGPRAALAVGLLGLARQLLL